ncbi:MAG TPA: phospholipase C, phosphocholine-specific [Tepidisphaeraceae bacterium]|nr:phospholipase C, phosphocholine-specific [Tepidisphaeraceae bacterium]
MKSRREFLAHAAAMCGAAGAWSGLTEPIRGAAAIDPEPGSSFLDAEHIVILMQENRSFDHCFGTLQGVRGFNDPRAIRLPSQHPVWVQSDAAGNSYAPFRLDLKESSSTWMGSLPHTWESQVDARNNGRYDRWLTAKRSDQRKYFHIPFTLGYYNRSDIPFYYDLADAFTICDQYFCSSLTPTTPNRLYLWTGTIRQKPSADSQANVSNENVDYNRMADWTTFPERLEDLGISWKIYQNELGFDSGLEEEAYAWLANFGDNPIEYFSQYHYGFADTYRAQLDSLANSIPARIESLKAAPSDSVFAAGGAKTRDKRIGELTRALLKVQNERARWSTANFAKLSPRERSLHEKAFCTNQADPFYRQMARMSYPIGNEQRRIQVPKGDVLHQFRKDVESGELPRVSWLVAPERYSDHPSSPWYGAWYIAQVMEILTKNPEVWKKTIFILTYDENDGFFDHVPPFVPPHPHRPQTGAASKGIDTGVEYVELEQDKKRVPSGHARESPIGLGYRVPTIIASPWTRGGCVCSQVFDHTSILQLLEKVLSHKIGKPVVETNISAWRRTVCGDLTSAFKSAPSMADRSKLRFPPKEQFIEAIDQARLKPIPSEYHALTDAEIRQLRDDPQKSPWMPRQESGVRRLCAAPYELYVNGSLSKDRLQFRITFKAGADCFGAKSLGSPFTAYATTASGECNIRNYAVAAGDPLEDVWNLGDFDQGVYRIRVHGPNGFFREFIGSADDPALQIRLEYARATPEGRPLDGNVMLKLTNANQDSSITAILVDRSYKAPDRKTVLAPDKSEFVKIDTRRSSRWYDSTVRTDRAGNFEQRFAGHVETGQWSHTDPAMGRSKE